MIFIVIRDRGIGQTLCSFEHVSCYFYKGPVSWN